MTAEELVDEVLRYMNEHRDAPPFIADDADLWFPGASMNLSGYNEEFAKMCRCFPDFHSEAVGDVIEHTDGTVSFSCVCTGTHTGTPYAFGPYPEIAATGIKIKLGPE